MIDPRRWWIACLPAAVLVLGPLGAGLFVRFLMWDQMRRFKRGLLLCGE